MSSGWNCFCRSATWVASASPGSQEALSFFSTLPSLPAIPPANTSTTIHNASTTHLERRPQTSRAKVPVVIAFPLMRQRAERRHG